MPRFLSRSKMMVVMRLFRRPLPVKSSFFSPSPAVAVFLYSTHRTSGSSVCVQLLGLALVELFQLLHDSPFRWNFWVN